MVYFLLICHVYFCFKTRFVQRHTLKGIGYSLSGGAKSTYSAFAAALGTTIGPGNIVGVAVAIQTGGAGAVLWMWLCGILSMATKYAESFLCLKFKQDIGGPMILLRQNGYKKTAVLWAFLCALAGLFMGAGVPSHSLSSTLPLPLWITGSVMAFLTLITVCFGVKGISKVCNLLVPIMSAGFIALCLVAIILNINELPTALLKIIRGAFLPSSAVGGGMGAAIKSGVTRGLYSNEAGLGSGGILASEANDKNTRLSALGAMTTAFWDTVVMCSLCGVVFVMGGAEHAGNPVSILKTSFCKIPFYNIFLCASMTMFVFATIIGWYYIARRVVEFLKIPTGVYDVAYIAFVFFGAVTTRFSLWKIADVLNFLMLLPSMFIFIRLSYKNNLYISDK